MSKLTPQLVAKVGSLNAAHASAVIGAASHAFAANATAVGPVGNFSGTTGDNEYDVAVGLAFNVSSALFISASGKVIPEVGLSSVPIPENFFCESAINSLPTGKSMNVSVCPDR